MYVVMSRSWISLRACSCPATDSYLSLLWVFLFCFVLFYVYGCFVWCVSVYHFGAWYLWKPEEGVGSPGAGVPDGCEPPGCDSNLAPLKEQPVFRPVATSLAPQLTMISSCKCIVFSWDSFRKSILFCVTCYLIWKMMVGKIFGSHFLKSKHIE